MPIVYKRDLESVNWVEMKAVLEADDFDNARSPTQLGATFANSTSTCIAYDKDHIVGTARLLIIPHVRQERHPAKARKPGSFSILLAS